MHFLLWIFTIFGGHLNFYPCQEGPSPGRASGKTSERPYVFAVLRFFGSLKDPTSALLLLFGKIDFYPCQEGPSPCRASGKTSERPYVFVCFCSLAIFWKPQGSHIGVTSSVAESIPLALTRRRASGAQARGNLRTPLCVCSRAVFYLLKPQLSYVCPTPGQPPEDAQRLGVVEIDATARFVVY